ncbi:MAG: FG-GAP-like repeat-containing protein [Candidatus Zixiibacteriota bacterium]
MAHKDQTHFRWSLFAEFPPVLVVLAAVLLVATSLSQAGQSREVAPFPVEFRGEMSQLPFWGGINSPKPTLIDLDRDGLVDLVYGDLSGKLAYFRNVGTFSEPAWQAVTQRVGGIDIGTWHTFADIDGDSLPDLFCDAHNGQVAYYQNRSTPGRLAFKLKDTAFGAFQTGQNNTPTFCDIDGDGDLDYFFGASSGFLDFYRNVGTVSSPSFVFITDVYDSVLAFPRPAKVSANPLHGFSTLTFADIDNDGDSDLFYGDIFNDNIYYFKNLGTASHSNLTYQTQTYLSEATLGFNHATLADLTGDGLVDMVLGVANAADVNNLMLWTNTGTLSNPVFTPSDSSMIHCIDFGSSTVPAFGDLDGDGDQDLLVGAEDGYVHYFKNIGTPGSPSLVLESDSLLGISALLNSAPSLVDWDSDGDLDMLLGTTNGKVEYWRNDGSATQFLPTKASAQLAGIKVDQLATPYPADLNDDGLVDLVVGEWDFNGHANVLLYRNTGTISAPNLVLQTLTLLKSEQRAFTLPYVVDWDGDGRKDIVLGTDSSGLVLYRNLAAPGAFPDSNSLVLQDEVMPGTDDGKRLAMTGVDIDNDGDRDYLIGEEEGGLNFYRTTGSCCVGARGNVNGVGGELLDLADVTALVNYLLGSDTLALTCRAEANADGSLDGAVGLVDLAYLIAYLENQIPALPTCF